MAEDADPVNVDEIIPVGKLFSGIFLVGQSVIPQVAVSVVVVPL